MLRLEATETGLELSLASKEYGDVVAPVKPTVIASGEGDSYSYLLMPNFN